LTGEGLAIAANSTFFGGLERLVMGSARTLSGGAAGPVWTGAAIALVGAVLCVVAVRRMMRSVLSAVYPGPSGSLTEILYQRHHLARGPRVVVIGGGTGLSVLLRGLKEYTSNITAIVTVADDGGSSGRLRREIGMLPPGDVRNCLVALADTEPLMESLFQHRFTKGDLKGHSFGNLFLAAMTEMTGDFEEAVRQSSKVLAVRGRVLPSTLENVTLCAVVEGGEVVRGETSISRSGKSIERVYLDPPGPAPLPEALKAIAEADLVVIGPGSLYTSVLPNLAVPQIVAALKETRATRVYVCNVMTQPGETDGYDASRHLNAVLAALGGEGIDVVIQNSETLPETTLSRYLEQGAVPVTGEIEAQEVRVLKKPLVSMGDHARHDPLKLAGAVMSLKAGKSPYVILS
ncbi:MAG: gluconeogenesis factor YvcK family protein, partial [Bacillota bacterium]